MNKVARILLAGIFIALLSSSMIVSAQTGSGQGGSVTDKDLGNAVGNQGNALLGQKIAGGVPFDKPFGGFISGVTPCICDTLGFIIDIAGPFGGSFVYSFTDKPKIHFGSFLSVAGPVLGAAKGSVSCGTDIDHGSCRGRRSGDLLKIIGGVL